MPGGVDSPRSLWQLLADGTDAIGDLPPDRWDWRRFHDTEADAPGKLRPRQAGFLDGDVTAFDAAFFGISPREAEVLDPQQRLLLELAWEAIEDGGIDPDALRGSSTGVFVGGFTVDNLLTRLGTLERDAIGQSTATSSTLVLLSNRISYALDLRGPSMTVDTACSSSLVATHLACQAIERGECEAALAAGVNIMLRPEMSIVMSKGGFLSPDSRSRAFDARANGYVRGEGAGVVLLKRAAAAVRDGDRIYALIRATASNQDGRTPGITVPSVAAQEALLREACATAGVEPGVVHVVEAHGTGTQAGDPIEANTLGAVLADGREDRPAAWLGSIKTNVGHLEAGAGIAGLIKLALQLHHRRVPRLVHFESANPKIDFARLPLRVPTESTALPATGDLFGVVNSFGYGGTNANAILSSAPTITDDEEPAGDGPFVLPLSARDGAALAARAAALQGRDVPLADLAGALANRRAHHPHRAAIVAADRHELAAALDAVATGAQSAAVTRGRASERRRPVFLYCGMGAQWEGMGSELFAHEPAFREWVERCDAIWVGLGGASLLPAFEIGGDATPIVDPIDAQPANFVLQVAVTELWRSRGVLPGAIVGHSVGEIAAAWAAGAVTLEDALRITYHRSRLQQRLAGHGGMLAVGLGEQAAAARLQGREDLVVAAINGTESVTLAGPTAALAELARELEAEGVLVRRLRVSVAYHSPQIEQTREFRDLIADLAPQAPAIPLYSTVTGARVTGAQHDAEYWWRNAREPVRLLDALSALAADGWTAFVEVGPHPVLGQAVLAAIPSSRQATVAIPSMRRGRGQREAIANALASLYVGGIELDWRSAQPSRRHVDLPAYPWQRERHWAETPISRIDRIGDEDPHPLLQRRQPTPRAAWDSDLNRSLLPWLHDHRVAGEAILPGAAFAVAALEAAARLERPRVAQDLRFERPLSVERATRMRVDLDDDGRFAIHSRPADGARWVEHASGRVAGTGVPPRRARLDLAGLASRLSGESAVDRFYERLRRRGLAYGSALRTVREVWTGAAEVLARLELSDLPDEHGPLHPLVLDGAFQAIFAAAGEGPLMVPAAMAEIRVHAAVGRDAYVHGTIRSCSEHALVADLELCAEDGTVLVEVFGLRCRAIAPAVPAADRLYEETWVPATTADTKMTGGWQVHGDGSPLAAQLQARLAGGPAEGRLGIVWLRGADPADYAGIGAASQLAAFLRERAGRAERLAIVTRGCRAVQPGELVAPADAPLLGLGRVALNELPDVDVRLVDVDEHADADLLARVLTTDQPDREWAVRGAQAYVSRMRTAHPEPGILDQRDAHSSALEITQPGVVESLVWTECERRAPGPGEVEIRVEAGALNFKDLMKVMGLLDLDYLAATYFGTSLGSEVAGVISAVGEGVRDLRVGEAVVALPATGGFRDYVTMPTHYVLRKPPTHGFEEAGVYVNFVPAYYGLKELGRLTAGERVLIHSATGGVGLAAIQIARLLGAEVLATAGSGAKRDYLRALGVAKVFDSRSLAFADEVLEATNGEGVDVVLNSIAGEAIDRNLRCLAPYGRFIEIGKRDILAGRPLGLASFDRNLTFSALDFDHMMRDRPDLSRRLLDECRELHESGALKPLPTQVFAVQDAAEAFRLLARGQHTGKIVLRFDGSQVVRRRVAIRDDATYVISGGLGGFGRTLAEWLVDGGARHLALIGRAGAADDDARAFVERLRARGVNVTTPRADVADREQLSRALEAIAAAAPPIRGVFHAAMVLDDGLLERLDAERLAAVMRPKALGAWHLHELTRGIELDCFVLFSSISALIGNPGQGSYVAANAYLDALAGHRRALGLPALSVNWGVLGDVGVAAREPRTLEQLERAGMRAMASADAVATLGRLLSGAPAQIGAFDIDWSAWAEAQPTVAGTPRWSQLTGGGGSGGAPADATGLHALDGEARFERVATILREQLARVLRMDVERIELDVGVGQLGVDSLMAHEVTTGIAVETGVQLPAMALMQDPTVAQLAERILATHGAGSPRSDDAVEAMSESELDALLALELGGGGA